MSAIDAALNIGEIPVVDHDAKPKEEKKPTEDEVKLGVQYMRIAILFCCSPITLADGRQVKVVEKELDQLGENEIAIGEIADEDAQAILRTCQELSGLSGKEAAPGAKSFPSEQENNGASGCDGETVRKTAVADPKAVPA